MHTVCTIVDQEPVTLRQETPVLGPDWTGPVYFQIHFIAFFFPRK